MTLKLYGVSLSQPSRAITIFVRANEIGHEYEEVNMAKGAHKSPEFLAINPRGQVPAIVDDGFNLSESATILRYLSVTRSVADHWYPADVKKRARVDALLDWYQSNLRQTARYVFAKELQPNLVKIPSPPEAELNVYERNMTEAFKYLEEVLLTSDGPFLLGVSEPSIADILLACEVTQTLLLTKEEYEARLGSHSKIKAWLSALEEKLAPHFVEVHSAVYSTAKYLESVRSERTQSAAL